MLKDAPAAIIVCGDQNILKFKDLWIQDCSAASENMLLAAHDLGLGAVWIGVYPVENMVREVRSIAEHPSKCGSIFNYWNGLSGRRKVRQVQIRHFKNP